MGCNRLVVTAYNRPGYFEPVCESWSAVRGLDDWHPVVFLEPSDVSDRMALLAERAGLQVFRNEERRGVLSNPWHALESAFRLDYADFAVLAEDDVVVSDDVLEYFEWCADRYRDDPEVLAVCAWTQAEAYPGAGHLVAKQSGFSPLVWGTWADRWFDVLGPTWDHDYGSGTDGKHGGWDWNINLRVGATSKFVYPAVSRSDHIGELYGTHMTPDMFHTSRAPSWRAHRDPGCFHDVGPNE